MRGNEVEMNKAPPFEKGWKHSDGVKEGEEEGMKNLVASPRLWGRDHNLYNGLAKVYPESRFLARREQRKESADPLVRSYSRCIIIALAVPFLTAFYSQYAHIRAVAESRYNVHAQSEYESHSRQQSLFKWKYSMLDRP